MLDDDKQLASGLVGPGINEAEQPEASSAATGDTTTKVGDKEKSDVSALSKGILRINTVDEWTELYQKLMSHAESIAGLNDTKVKALLTKSIRTL